MFFKKCVLFAALFCTMLVAQGCETPKAVGHDTYTFTNTFADKIRQADAWVTEHLW